MPFRSIRWVALVLCCFAILSSAGTSAQDLPQLKDLKRIEIDLDYSPPLRPFMSIMVRINDSAPMRFLIDTGCASPIVIDRSVAEKLHLPKTGVTSTIKQGHMPSEEVSVKSIEYVARGGVVNIEHHTADVADLNFVRSMSGRDFDGVLGMPAFEKVTSQFYLATHTLTLFRDMHAPYRPLGSASLPLEHADNGLMRVHVDVGNTEALMDVDTGSIGTSLPLAAAATQRPLAHGWTGRAQVDGSFGISDELLLPQVRIGDLVERRVLVDVEQPGDSALLGMDLLRRFRITLDPRNRLLTLERAADYADRCRLPGESGITISRRGKRVFVRRVTTTSSAAKAGIRTGDEILSADGVEPGNLTQTQFYAVLDGTESTTAQLRIRHGTESPRDVQFVRSSEFDGKGDSVYGLMLWKPKGKPIQVVSVAKGTPGGDFGLRPGDIIVQIGGEETRGFTPESFAGKCGNKGLRLKVKRPGTPHLITLRLHAEPDRKR